MYISPRLVEPVTISLLSLSPSFSHSANACFCSLTASPYLPSLYKVTACAFSLPASSEPAVLSLVCAEICEADIHTNMAIAKFGTLFFIGTSSCRRNDGGRGLRRFHLRRARQSRNPPCRFHRPHY